MTERISTITVSCQCGVKLFKYQKVGTGRLIKCFLDRLLADYVQIPKNIMLGEPIRCPSCKNRVGTTQRILREFPK
ncbi:MAG: hypothetical protein FJY98_04515 [Candidatus Liptonbacteria bacterium]|nr:hypothetical protein [Candidatus Liptonbacteria bacterium]